MQLFRKEVLDAKNSQWTGQILLLRPVSMKIATFISAIIGISLLTYVVTGEYTRKVKVSGQLVTIGGVIKIVAPQAGRVLSHVDVIGEPIKNGQLLYEIFSDRDIQGGRAGKMISETFDTREFSIAQENLAQQQQLKNREHTLKSKKTFANDEIIKIDQEIQLQISRVRRSEELLKKYRQLREQGFVSEFQLFSYENDFNDQISKEKNLERSKIEIKREIVQIQDEIDQISSQRSVSDRQTERMKATLAQEVAENKARNHVEIRAVVDGTIASLSNIDGQTVQPGVNLASILTKKNALVAQLYVPSHAVGFVETGQTVQLRLNAFPYQKFGQISGIVSSVEKAPILEFNKINDSTASNNIESAYLITVKISRQSIIAYGKEQFFRQGMSVDADIRQDRRKLIEWIIDPIVSIAKNHAN